MGMNHEEAWSWLCAHLGDRKAMATVAICEQYPDKLEAIVVTMYHASDPRRQQFRIAVRTLMESENK